MDGCECGNNCDICPDCNFPICECSCSAQYNEEEEADE